MYHQPEKVTLRKAATLRKLVLKKQLNLQASYYINMQEYIFKTLTCIIYGKQKLVFLVTCIVKGL